MERFAGVVGGLLLLSMVAWAGVGCSGDDETPVGEYGEQCDVSTTCADGLTCLHSLCTVSCSDGSECQALSASGTCMNRACFDSCTTAAQCPPGLNCEFFASTTGTCRVPRGQ